ncbi:hypothetical protein SAMN05443550_102217 [Pedobacter hartonius]|uniref:Uncharacterized protein n=1 Tax=Pedobacter hartonius TaxID=425514 RepID=A0A1H3Z2P9_9SPHI|nr:hypothetical protein SAMN05443550_102217 [Pedobacter hartonius]
MQKFKGRDKMKLLLLSNEQLIFSIIWKGISTFYLQVV